MEKLPGRSAAKLVLGLDRVGLRRQRAPPVSRRHLGPACSRGGRLAPAAARLDLSGAHRAGDRAVARPERHALPLAVRSRLRLSWISRAGAVRDPGLLRDVGPGGLWFSVHGAATAGGPAGPAAAAR